MALALACGAPARGATPDARTPLHPEEVVVVANFSVPESVDLARHYMEVRGIPARQLLVTGMTAQESVKRADYERTIAEPIKSFLVEEKLDRVRCLVLMYGVPLRVLEPEQNFDQKRMEMAVNDNNEDKLKELADLIAKAGALGGGAAPPPPALAPKSSVGQKLDALDAAFMDELRAALARIAARPAGDARADLEAQWLAIWRKASGFAPPEAGAFAIKDTSPTAAERLAGYAKRIRELMAMPLDMTALRELMGLLGESRGAIGSLQASEGLLDLIKPSWRQRAAVDSELCTLFWPPFPTAGPLLNPMHLSSGVEDGPRTLLACRLDGPDPATVRRMIDDSAAAEKTGLKGRCYLDSRGLGPGSVYSEYDGDLVKLARIVARATSLTVVLDERDALFAPGSCPDAALYCGWYSLAQYVPAFTFVRGAVGYHIASSEASTLHKAGSKCWCPSMLAAGAAATLGPVEEPYLTAFPQPAEFFTLLLSGKYPLANCYFLTVRHLSWMMTLIGDPLYNPYAAHPALDLDAIESLDLSK